MSNVCPKCHAYNSDSSQFCAKCGAPLGSRAGGSKGSGKTSSLSTVGFILSIVCCALSFVPYANITGFACGVPALIFSILSSRDQRLMERKSTIVIIALVLSIVGLALSAIGISTVTVCFCRDAGCYPNF